MEHIEWTGREHIRYLIEALEGLGTREVGHSGGALINHLIGTYVLLKKWQLDRSVCEAGLYHSVYGTESFSASSLSAGERRTVVRAIGERAENLVYLFGIMNRSSFYRNLFDEKSEFLLKNRLTRKILSVDRNIFVDLCHIVLANWLEQKPRVPEGYENWRMKEMFAMRAYLCDLAIADLKVGYRGANAGKSAAPMYVQ